MFSRPLPTWLIPRAFEALLSTLLAVRLSLVTLNLDHGSAPRMLALVMAYSPLLAGAAARSRFHVSRACRHAQESQMARINVTPRAFSAYTDGNNRDIMPWFMVGQHCLTIETETSQRKKSSRYG